MAPIKTILHLTPFYPPNIGGVETHLQDLTQVLSTQNYRQIVLTYSPLTTTVTYQRLEKKPNLIIRRFYLFGHNLFHTLEKYPLLNFCYITPYLLVRSILWLLFHPQKIDTIHSHGLNGAIIGNILQKIFSIPRHLTSIYSTYDNVPLNSLGTKILVSTLNHTNHIVTQTDQSIHQLISLGVEPKRISRYYHWLDLNRFHPVKNKPSTFSVLFIGRLIPAKNALMLAKVASKFPQLIFNFVGTGPDYPSLKKMSLVFPNIRLHGDIPYSRLHEYYQSNSILCLPSKYSEGWGRVLAESVACGTPVICSHLGGTVEAVDSTVAILIPPTISNFTKSIRLLSTHSKIYLQMCRHCRPYATQHYSSDNIHYITQFY
ncbi:MAG: glycosyltransferase family 4 protein [Microgenomates group bacterium]